MFAWLWIQHAYSDSRCSTKSWLTYSYSIQHPGCPDTLDNPQFFGSRGPRSSRVDGVGYVVAYELAVSCSYRLSRLEGLSMALWFGCEPLSFLVLTWWVIQTFRTPKLSVTVSGWLTDSFRESVLWRLHKSVPSQCFHNNSKCKFEN